MDRHRSVYYTTNNMNKLLLLLLTIPLSVQSSVYLEYKNELPIHPIVGPEVNHFRIGETTSYKGISLYYEVGVMTNGYSYESGYKYQRGSWTIKGKYENKSNSRYEKSKLQTEIRYTF